MLTLRRVGKATLLRDSDKVPELMNFHRRSDTPLGPPVCLRLVDRHFWIRLGSIRASRVVLGALAEQLFLISDLWSLISGSGRGTKRGLCGTITLVNELAVWSNPQEWKSTTFSDTTGERARLACWFWRQNELSMI